MAAGATIGSNHNSRSPDGEIIAGRGFWPGLCVSLKHNSVFASFSILAKGDYPAELHITFPFSLISNDTSRDQLVIMPAYWFMYNMYALARNSWKYIDRDKRTDKTQLIEYDFLAPDSVNEIIHSLETLKLIVGNAYAKKFNQRMTEFELKQTGERLLASNDRLVNELELLVPEAENSDRKVVLIKGLQAYQIFKELVNYYAVTALLHLIETNKIKTTDVLLKQLPAAGKLQPWVNAGGQLIPNDQMIKLLLQIRNGKTKNWAAVHHFYKKQSELYPAQKLGHALAALQTVYGINLKKDKASLKQLLQQSIYTKEWMVKGIYDSRAKDYTNPFRKMVYENRNEMDKVTGSLEKNSFIRQEQENLVAFKKTVQRIIKAFKL